MITGIAVILALVLLMVKFLFDSSENRLALRVSRFLVWAIVPLLLLFFISVMVRVGVEIKGMRWLF